MTAPRPPRARRRREGADRTRAQRSAAQLVEGVLRKVGAAGAVREHRLVTHWQEIVGDRVASRAWPSALRKGLLYIRVANSAWMHELTFLKDALVRAANAAVGDPPLVREVRFHLGDRSEPDNDPDDVVAALAQRARPKPTPRPPRPAADAAARARITSETDQVGDSELRDAVRALRTRLGM